MTVRLASLALGAFFLASAPAWAAEAAGSAGSGSGTPPSAPTASAAACKGAREGATCKFQGRRGHEVSGTCTSHNGGLACVPAHRGMHRGGQGAPTPMQTPMQ